MLDSAARHIYKATLVPLRVPVAQVGQALPKLVYLRSLGLGAGEAAELAPPGAASDAVREFFAALTDGTTVSFTARMPALAEIPFEQLLSVGHQLVELRQAQVRASAKAAEDASASGAAQLALRRAQIAVRQFEADLVGPKLGLMNLERLEMAPAGIERGELIATIPLAPLEQTAVTQKEWSVQKKEFTSIVTDSLETLSETGVTDNTELSQAATSEQEHSNQFNITGTVKGGIPVISGSVTSTYTGQSKESNSATESRKHATSLTQKASTRSKQEHKVTISTTTVTGTEQSTTRSLKNPSDQNAIRIDYFSMMRKWQVRLYRFGLRQTYDIVLPEPAASLRAAYVELAELKAKLAPFVFTLPVSDITSDVRTEDPEPPPTNPPTPKQPHYLVLAERFHVPPPPPPPRPVVTLRVIPEQSTAGRGRSSGKATVNVRDGYEIRSVVLNGHMSSSTGPSGRFTIEGTTLAFDPWDYRDYHDEKLVTPAGADFMAGSTGSQPIVLVFEDVATAALEFTVTCVPTVEAMAQWRADVWNGFYNALQTQYYADQQDIAGRIAALEDRLAHVDTLTLRREENDEVMKGVLRYLLGGKFPTMPAAVVKEFVDNGIDVAHGTSFDSRVIGPDSTLWSVVREFEDHVRFVNQAIEWENVTSFLYSYFWDIPDSWAFIRGIKHPDANRQAFLRAGSARVVLTIRKGWETRWANFVERGVIDDPTEPSTPSRYWSIAQEIAAYDDRNYPGIPPANPGRSAARLQDSVFTNAPVTVGPSTGPVSVQVESSAGFTVGGRVVVDSVRDLVHVQEVQTIVSIPADGTHLVLSKLAYQHVGTAAAPFPIVQPGEKGELIAEWNEYTPTSGTDIAVSSNLGQVS
ncbi:hypothetical protein IU476_27215 [Nocardia blacklockiae]|nr:hypothetical protein [Nocardia blacklockiae]